MKLFSDKFSLLTRIDFKALSFICVESCTIDEKTKMVILFIIVHFHWSLLYKLKVK